MVQRQHNNNLISSACLLMMVIQLITRSCESSSAILTLIGDDEQEQEEGEGEEDRAHTTTSTSEEIILYSKFNNNVNHDQEEAKGIESDYDCFPFAMIFPWWPCPCKPLGTLCGAFRRCCPGYICEKIPDDDDKGDAPTDVIDNNGESGLPSHGRHGPRCRRPQSGDAEASNTTTTTPSPGGNMDATLVADFQMEEETVKPIQS